MRKQISRIAIVAYFVVVAVVVWRADVKYGVEQAAWFGGFGLVFLIVIWRLWRGFRYVIFGGRVPIAAVGQNTQFQPPSPRKAPPRP